MSTCPRCHQFVEAQAVSCPHCDLTLKAFGHPGIPLHQATKDTFLCERCTYHADDTCTFPQRPYAKTCTLYQDRSHQSTQNHTVVYRPSKGGALKAWLQRNRGIIILVGILTVSLLIAL